MSSPASTARMTLADRAAALAARRARIVELADGTRTQREVAALLGLHKETMRSTMETMTEALNFKRDAKGRKGAKRHVEPKPPRGRCANPERKGDTGMLCGVCDHCVALDEAERLSVTRCPRCDLAEPHECIYTAQFMTGPGNI